MNTRYLGKRIDNPLPAPMPEAKSILANAPQIIAAGVKRGWVKLPSTRSLTDHQIESLRKAAKASARMTEAAA